MAAMVPPADHQTGPESPVTNQKDQPHHGENLHPVPTSTNPKKNTAANAQAKGDLPHLQAASPIKAGRMAINRQAVSAAGPEKKNRFHRAANHIPADHRTTMTVQKVQEAIATVTNHPAANLLPGERHHIPAE